jgi:hypothetical protein
MKIKPLYFSGSSLNILPLLFSLLALLSGIAIYLLFRDGVPSFVARMHDPGLSGLISTVRQKALLTREHMPAWIVYSLPDGLWSFAYAVLITSIWWRSKSWLKYGWMATIPVLIFGFEMLQYAGIIPGTCSTYDIVLGMIGIIVGVTVGILTTKPIHHEKSPA